MTYSCDCDLNGRSFSERVKKGLICVRVVSCGNFDEKYNVRKRGITRVSRSDLAINDAENIGEDCIIV